MSTEEIEIYVRKRLMELEQQKDLQRLLQRGELSFGIDADTYGHLPAWNELIEKKKKLKRWLWIHAFIIAVAAVAFAGDYFNRFAQDWLKALLSLVMASGFFMLFYVFSSSYTFFVKFRHTEREVRKLIYQDILYQLNKEEKATV